MRRQETGLIDIDLVKDMVTDTSLQIMAIDKQGDITMEFDVFRPESSWNGGRGVARQITNYKPMR